MADNRATQNKPRDSAFFKKGSKIGPYTVCGYYFEGSQSTIFTVDNDKLARVYFRGCEPDKKLSALMKASTETCICIIIDSGTIDNHYYEIVEKYTPIPNLGSLPKSEQLKLLQKETDAIKAFHGLGYCHLDIKKEHFMMDRKGNVVLIDIGSAAKIGTVYTKKISQFAPNELYSGKFSKESDYFSFGISILEQYIPDLFKNKTREEIIEYIQSPKILEACSRLPFECRETVKMMLSDNPNARGKNDWFGKRETRRFTQTNSLKAVKPENDIKPIISASISSIKEDIIFELLELAHKGEPVLFTKQIKNACKALNINDAVSATAFLKYLRSLPRADANCNYTNATKKNILKCLEKNVVTNTNKFNSRNPVTYMKFLCLLKKLYVLDKNQVTKNERTGAEISKISEERAWAILKGIGITLGVIAAIAAAIGVIIVICYVIAAIAICALIIGIIAGLCSG